MGGPGSGRWYRWNTKETVAEYRQVDIRHLKREGVLDEVGSVTRWAWRDSESGEQTAGIVLRYECRSRLRFQYRVRRTGEERRSVDLPVQLERTPCNFGGERPWFRCPGQDGHRRCAILYMDIYPLCRECLDLTYPRCNLSGNPFEIARHKLRKLARKLDADPREGWGPLWQRSLPDKPKHMHRDTYHEHAEEWHRLQRMGRRAYERKLREFSGRLSSIGGE